MIIYQDNLEGITASSLAPGFFDGWPNPPSSSAFMKILNNSTYVILAIDDSSKQVVGFINALSDQILTAYIPLLEVIPSYKGKGVGRELTVRMLDRLKDFYMVDLLCDPELQGFYSQYGMKKASGMMTRNYSSQSGLPADDKR